MNWIPFSVLSIWPKIDDFRRFFFFSFFIFSGQTSDLCTFNCLPFIDGMRVCIMYMPIFWNSTLSFAALQMTVQRASNELFNEQRTKYRFSLFYFSTRKIYQQNVNDIRRKAKSGDYITIIGDPWHSHRFTVSAMKCSGSSFFSKVNQIELILFGIA